jgi:hypothetical protein
MNSKLHLCGARSWTWHWSFEKTKAARFNVSLRCMTSSGFFFIVDGLVFKLSYAKKKSENLFYLVRNSMRSHDLARWDRCGKGAMNTLETNRGRNKRRRRWANWLHNKLHKQPDPESAAAIASITAMLTAQSVLWQQKIFFRFFSRRNSAEQRRHQKRFEICKIKEDTVIGSAGMLSSTLRTTWF